MRSHPSHRHVLTDTLGVTSETALVTPRQEENDLSAKVLERASLALDEVATFLEVEASPHGRRLAARALAYATALDEPLDRMAGLMLARAWLAADPPALLRPPAGRLRLHMVATH